MTRLAINTECLATLEHNYITLVPCPAKPLWRRHTVLVQVSRAQFVIGGYKSIKYIKKKKKKRHIRALLKTQSHVFRCQMKQMQWQEWRLYLSVNIDTKVSIGYWTDSCMMGSCTSRKLLQMLSL